MKVCVLSLDQRPAILTVYSEVTADAMLLTSHSEALGRVNVRRTKLVSPVLSSSSLLSLLPSPYSSSLLLPLSSHFSPLLTPHFSSLLLHLLCSSLLSLILSSSYISSPLLSSPLLSSSILSPLLSSPPLSSPLLYPLLYPPLTVGNMWRVVVAVATEGL